MKSSTYYLLLALTFVALMPVFSSCNKDNQEQVDPIPNGEVITLTATVEQHTVSTATKTSLGTESGGITPVNWSEGESIRVFGIKNGSYFVPGYIFWLSQSQGGTTATFLGNLQDSAAPLVAYSPSTTITAIDATTGDLTVTIPASQGYRIGNIQGDTNPMVARAASGTNLDFKNIFGIVKLSLTGSVKVSQIVLRSESYLSGTGIVKYNDGNPTITFNDASNKYVSLNCGSPVQLSENATDFYIVVPPTTNGFTVEIGTDSGIMTKTIPSTNATVRSKILKMPSLETTAANFAINSYEGVTDGTPTFIAGTWWAPVNCGYNATTNPRGLLYQWGRKVGQGYDGEDNEPELRDFIVRNESVPRDNEFYKGAESGDITVTDKQWMSLSQDGGAAFDEFTLWSNLSSDTFGEKVGDPCPSGWRVPTIDELDALRLLNSAPSIETASHGSSDDVPGAYFPSMWPNIFLPTSSYRDYYGIARGRRDEYAVYYSSTPSDYNAYGIDFQKTASPPYGSSSKGAFPRADGFLVRCVADVNPPVDTLSTKSPVTKKLNNMLDVLGLVAGTKSYSAANGDITRYSFFDDTKGGTVSATLNEDESTENKLVYDRDIVDILDNHSPGQVVLEPTADGIKTTFYDVDGLKIKERILEIKDGEVIESEDGENIYKYSKDTHNSLLVTKFSNNATFEISDINIVKK